ncbi:MAG: hypothetical protein FWE28_06445 [Oscillospiraceae bacterium]|nr:hypothetical protein [Oscillospiraceae bacterium]
MPLESALKPQESQGIPPSSTHPKLAFKAGTTGFTDMPDEGFLGPSWGSAVPTRILHRCAAYSAADSLSLKGNY